MSSNKLRDYQVKAIEEIRKLYGQRKKRVLLYLSTGAGKTTVFSYIIKGIHTKGKKGIVVVKGRDLVDNASQRLFREGVPHGVLMQGHWNYKPNENIQVCSVDTLFARKLVPDCDLVCYDECHDTTSNKYKWLNEHYKDKFILAVSATPHVKSGLKHVADHVVRPITINELMQQGYLVKPRYFAPTKIDLTGLKIDKKTGDYVTSELENKMDDRAIFGDLVASYNKFASGRKAIVFCVSIKHANHVKEYFIENSLRAEQVDAKTPRKKREQIIKDLEDDKLDIITNVNVFSVGVDIPCLSAIIHARPTKSYNFWVQSNGRGTRPYPNKKDFIILDHVGNIGEHGLIEDERECLLEGWSQEIKTESVLNCEQCYIVYSTTQNYKTALDVFGSEDALISFYNEKNELKKYGDRAFRTKRLYFCLDCGYNNTPDIEPVNKELENEDDKLKELTEEQIINIKCKTRLAELKKIKKTKGHKRGWIFYTLKAEFGEELASKYVKKIVVPDWVNKKVST